MNCIKHGSAQKKIFYFFVTALLCVSAALFAYAYKIAKECVYCDNELLSAQITMQTLQDPDVLEIASNINSSESLIYLSLSMDVEGMDFSETENLSSLCDDVIEKRVEEYKEKKAAEEAARKAAEEAAKKAAEEAAAKAAAINSVSTSSVASEIASRSGMYGRLTIPSVGVNVALFSCSAKDSQKSIQKAIIDAEDSATYMSWGGGLISGDHAYQEYEDIKQVVVGAKLYIYTASSVQTYTCIKKCNGTNPGIVTDDNGVDTRTINDGLLILYTCNDTSGYYVTITTWQPD